MGYWKINRLTIYCLLKAGFMYANFGVRTTQRIIKNIAIFIPASQCTQKAQADIAPADDLEA